MVSWMRQARRQIAVMETNRRVLRYQSGWQNLRALREQQWLPYNRLMALQSARLQRLIAHAYANVPYYREVMNERGLYPGDIRSKADLERLPILTKEIIRARLADLRATGGVDRPHLTRENHTGGSTGTPLTFYQDEAYRTWAMMDLDRDFEMCGYRHGDPIAFLWGSDYDNRPRRTLLGKLKDWLANTMWLDAFDAVEEDYVTYAHALAAFRPTLLVGYVSSLVVLARVIRAYHLPRIRIGSIQSSAETLTPPQRDLLEETFQCRVFDRYGCREVANIAHECDAHRGLHALEDNNLVEVVVNGRPAVAGENGELVVTNLHNYAMPFIRYANGDMAIPSDERCPCSRGFPLLKAVTGRRADIIRTPSGRILHGEFFTHLFYKTEGVSEFQVAQRTLTRLEISIVPEPTFDRASLEFLETMIHEHGDSAFEVTFNLTDSITRSSSGKFRFTLSDLPFELTAERSSRS